MAGGGRGRRPMRTEEGTVRGRVEWGKNDWEDGSRYDREGYVRASACNSQVRRERYRFHLGCPCHWVPLVSYHLALHRFRLCVLLLARFSRSGPSGLPSLLPYARSLLLSPWQNLCSCSCHPQASLVSPNFAKVYKQRACPRLQNRRNHEGYIISSQNLEGRNDRRF